MWQEDVFLVDRYEILIEVGPVARADYQVYPGVKPWVAKGCDNIASLRRTVTFSPHNICPDLFTLRYATRGDGFIRPPQLDPLPNEAAPAELGRYDDRGKEVTFSFTPLTGVTYFMGLEILKGFDPGDRNAHFHLHRKTRYETIVVTLDLRQYLDASFPITRGPDLHFHADDPQDHDLCKLRSLGHVQKPQHVGRGRWTWQIFRVNQGVIDLVWDLDGPETRRLDEDADEKRREELVRENLRAFEVVAMVMKVVKDRGPVSFRQVKERGKGIIPETGPGSDLPLSEGQISKYARRVEGVLADRVFFGRAVRLFVCHPGRASEPGPDAERATRWLQPYLIRISGQGSA